MGDSLKAMMAVLVVGLMAGLCIVGCEMRTAVVTTPESRSGVKAAQAQIEIGPDGLTVEQRNVKARLETDNKPGSIKHLYVFSAYSGQCILYSTVKGKVTSSGKRLSPKTVSAGGGYRDDHWYGFGPEVRVGNNLYRTGEVLEDDGTYGSSMDYVFWFDQRGVYHQHYVAGGQILHVANEPMPVKSVIVNIELTGKATDK